MCNYKILPKLKTAIIRQAEDERIRIKEITGRLLKEEEDYDTLFGTSDCQEAIVAKLRCAMFFYVIDENDTIKMYDGSITLVKIHDYYTALEIKNLLKL